MWWWLQKLDLSQISNGSNVPQINNGDIEPLQINVPSRREQDEIARRLQASFAWLDRVVVEHANASRLLTRLDQAILAKAFRGEMVPQTRTTNPWKFAPLLPPPKGRPGVDVRDELRTEQRLSVFKADKKAIFTAASKASEAAVFAGFHGEYRPPTLSGRASTDP